ncbi:MAG: hypothetical protein LBT27_04950 [Prevotellaceae bacterium]|jgi:hypothetical protein|nr:hypothetical protein [Prevotellaceae bacterium]
MSERRSTYVFKEEKDYNNAKDALYYQMNSDYYSSDKLYFLGWYGGEYRIDIQSDCSDVVKAAEICREHHGKFVANP